MPTEIEENADEILLAIAQTQENKGSQEYLSAQQIQTQTHLQTNDINNAILRLEDFGYVELIKGMGQHPFSFELAKITHTGFNKAQKIIEQKKESKKIKNQIYHFLIKNKWVRITENLGKIAKAILALIGLSAIIYATIYIPEPKDNLLKMNINNYDKIVFNGKTDMWNYNTTLNFNLGLWFENPSEINIYFVNFTKANNTVQKKYMVETLFNYTDYEVYPNNLSKNVGDPFENIPIESTNRHKEIPISIDIHLKHFAINGSYINSTDNFFILEI